MTPLEWVVILGGLLLIIWINWYFFLADKGSSPGERVADEVGE